MRAAARLALPRKLVSPFAGATAFIVGNEGAVGDFVSIHPVFEFPEDGIRVDGGAQSPLIAWDGGELWITALVADFTIYRVLTSERGRGVQQRRKIDAKGAGGGGDAPAPPPPPPPGGNGGDGDGGFGCVLAGTKIVPLSVLVQTRLVENNLWAEIELADGRKLTATPNHPVYTDRGKNRLDSLRLGEEVVTDRGLVAVTARRVLSMPGHKVCVSLKDGYLFWANGILSHNKRAL